MKVDVDDVVLLAQDGSRLYGLDLERSDTDYVGVCVEPVDAVLGLGKFEAVDQRTAGEGNRSTGEDTDFKVYGLKHFLQLATAGNPSVLALLFAPESMLVEQTESGRALQALAPSVLSQRLLPRFYGYGRTERQRVEKLHELGDDPYRAAKAASHSLRLAYQMLELTTTGRLTLPMPGYAREECLAVKRGELDLAYALDRADAVRNEAEAAQTVLAEQPDLERVHAYMRATYHTYYFGA